MRNGAVLVAIALAAPLLSGCVLSFGIDEDCESIVRKPGIGCYSELGPVSEWYLHVTNVTIRPGSTPAAVIVSFVLHNVEPEVVTVDSLSVLGTAEEFHFASSDWFETPAEIPSAATRTSGYAFERLRFEQEVPTEGSLPEGSYIFFHLHLKYEAGEPPDELAYTLAYKSNCFQRLGDGFVSQSERAGRDRCDMDVLDMDWPDGDWIHLPGPRNDLFWNHTCAHCYAPPGPHVRVVEA